MKRHNILSIANRYLNNKTTGWEVDAITDAVIVYALKAIYIDGRYYSMKTGNEISISKENYIRDIRNNMKEGHQHDGLEATGTGIIVHRICNGELEFLLQLRSDLNQYGLLGGGLELGDNFKQCAAKELLEEASILANENNLHLKEAYSGAKHITRYPSGDLVFHTIIVYSVDYAECKQLDLQTNTETKALRWISYSELKKCLSKNRKSSFLTTFRYFWTL